MGTEHHLAHKCILAARTTYFQALFRSGVRVPHSAHLHEDIAVTHARLYFYIVSLRDA